MSSNTITVDSNKNPSIINETVYFFGNLRDYLGEPIREIAVWWRLGAGLVHKIYTDIENGRFGFQIQFNATGQYSVQVCENESFGYAYAKADMIQTVSLTPPPKVTLKIAVNDPVQGNTEPTPGEYSCNFGQDVNIKATPKAGSSFDWWKINDMTQTSTNPLNLLMDKNMNVTAYFSYTIPPPPPPPPPGKCNFRIVATLGGTTNPPPGDYVAYIGQQIDVTAIPNSGYKLKQWVRNNQNVGNDLKIRVNIDVPTILLVASFDKTPPVDLWGQLLAWWNSLPTWQKALVAGGIPVTMLGVLIANKRKR